MKEVIDCGLPALAQPFSWAFKGGGLLFTAHGPVRLDGSIDTGPIEDQPAPLLPVWWCRA